MASELVTVDDYTRAITFAVLWITLTSSHYVADYWLQTDWQAIVKTLPGWTGSRACALHVLGHVCTGWVFITVTATVTGILPSWSLVWALVVIAVSHYWADRRYTLRWLAGLIGKQYYYDHGGAPHLDQAFHHFWIFVASLLAAATM